MASGLEDAKRELEAASGPLRSEGKVVEAAVAAVIARAECATVTPTAATAAADWAARHALQRLVLLATRRDVQSAPPAQNLILRPTLRIAVRLLPTDATEILVTLSRILAPTASNLFYLKCALHLLPRDLLIFFFFLSPDVDVTMQPTSSSA